MARVRYSLEYLQDEYSKGNHEPLDKLIRAFRGIQDYSRENPNDPNGFFVIGGFHGEPFHGAGAMSSDDGYWGGYCNHGNVLFPTWHRAYVLRLENAMRTVKGCEDVTMPFWDEFFYYNGDPNKPGPAKAIPAVLTDEFWPPGSKNKNPLRSYHFPRHLVDAASHNQVYNKHKDYETVRFPYSGLVGTDAAKKDTEQWNAQYSTLDAVDILNTNVSRWLNQGIKIDPKGGVKNPDTYSTGARYARCMDAPNYMVFSNKSSAQQYMTDHDIEVKDHFVVSLEDPHNAIHLSLGGVNQDNYSADPKKYEFANGDMGENNTAALDPIFFFHHCFIDYTFWTWQRRWNLTKRGQLTVDWGYAGTNSSDGGGAPAYQVANAFIDMDTPLYPFRKEDKSWFTSNDVTNIEELGYSYFHEGSLEPFAHRRSLLVTPQVPSPAKVLRVSGINRLKYEGSFVVRTIVMKDGEEYEVGRDPILSRWKVQGCLNCQNHLEVKSYVPIHQEFLDALGGGFEDEGITVEARVQTHGHRDGVRTAMRMGRDKPQQPVVEVL